MAPINAEIDWYIVEVMVKLDHLTLAVRDYHASRDWYVRNLGLSVEFEIPDRRVAALQDDGGFTIFLEQASIETPPACVLYFQVDNVDEAHARLASQGVPFSAAPARQFWGYGAELNDPDGYRLRLWDAATMKAEGE